MTDEEIVHLDNAAQSVKWILERVAEAELFARDHGQRHSGAETLRGHMRDKLRDYEAAAEQFGGKPLPKRPAKVDDEPEGLPADLLPTYRAIRARIAGYEAVTRPGIPVGE